MQFIFEKIHIYPLMKSKLTETCGIKNMKKWNKILSSQVRRLTQKSFLNDLALTIFQ